MDESKIVKLSIIFLILFIILVIISGISALFESKISSLGSLQESIRADILNYKNDIDQTNLINALKEQLNNAISREFHVVDATVYQLVPEQCDDSPDVLACNERVKIELAGKYRYLAISQDMHKRNGGHYEFGDLVEIRGCINEQYNGIWVVKDLMNKKWKQRIDFMVDLDALPIKETNVLIANLGIKHIK